MMKKSILMALLIMLPLYLANAKEQPKYQMPDTQVVPMTNTETGEQYELYIKLPEDYADKENTGKQYPVLYFTDAVWHIELLSSATDFLLNDIILVGISWQKDTDAKRLKEVGPYVSRFKDYSFSTSSDAEKQAKYQFGHADSHLAFIRRDVISYVEKNFNADANNRSYFGYSLGGLFGAYVLLAEPDTFNHYLLGSPSVWRLPKLKAKANTKNSRHKANVFISNGSLEDKLGPRVAAFIDYLESSKLKNLAIHHAIIDGSHQTAFPSTGVQGITWLANLYEKTDQSEQTGK